MRIPKYNTSILNRILRLFNPKQNVSISPSPFKIGRVLRITSILIISASILYNNVFAVSPSVDGRFYGDGDEARYTLMGVNSNGWGSLYTRMENDNVYVALVVDRSANDTVIGQWNPKPSDRDYLNSAGWNNRGVDQLINSEFAEFTFTICEGAGAPYEATYTWQQAFGYDSDGDENPSEADWVSDNLQAPGLGTAPPGMVSASSIIWNLNNYALGSSPAWDVTIGGTKNGLSEWKSPYDDPDTVIGVSGYPAIGDITFDSDHGWEWPMVYEWAVPLDDYIDNCAGYPLFVVSGTSHHSPSKIGDENIPIDEIIVPEFIDFGDLPDTYGTLLASDSARHNIPIGSAYLGISVDPESDGQPSVGTSGDDNSGDDEDGIVFLTPMTPGTQAQIQVTAGTAGYLSVYIDFDNDGILDAVSLDSATGPAAVATGTISDTHLSAAGTYIFTITVPADAASTIYSRFRFTTNSGDGGASATGLATTGEVEDYVLVSEVEVYVLVNEVKESPSLTIEKSTNTEDADETPGPSIAVGGIVNWSYVVENTGNVTLTNVTVTDNQIADDTTIDCGGATGTENVIASLLSGSDNKVTCTATGTATLGQYSNIGTASTIYESDPVSDTDPSHYFGLNPSMSIEKTVTDVDGEGSSSVVNEAGDIISYQVVLTNDGNQDLTNITLDDSLVTVVGTEIESITNDDVLEVGETWTYTYTYIVLQADLDNNGGGDGDIDNTATGDSDETEPVDSSADVPIVIYSLDITKTTSTTPVTATGNVTYTIKVENTGTELLTNVQVTDDLNATFGAGKYSVSSTSVTSGLTKNASFDGTIDQNLLAGTDSLANRESGTITVNLTLNNPSLGTHTNTAVADSDETDSADDTADVLVETYILEVTKTTSTTPVSPSGNVTYTIKVENNGTGDITNLQVTDNLDDTFGAGKYTVTSTSVDLGLTKNGSFDGTSDTDLLIGTDTLLAGTSKNITVNLTLINASLGTHTNTAVADSDETPSDNDTANVVVETFTVVKDFVAGDYSNHAGTTNPEVTIGEMIQYQVEVTFLGGTFTDVLIVDTLDLGLAFVQCDSFSIGTLTVDASNCTSPSVTPAVGAGDLAATSISWDLGDVVSTGLSTDKIILTYTVVVLNNSANVRDLSLNNNVVVTSTSSTASNVATAPLVTIVEPTLQIQKSVDKESVLPGDIVTYMIEISHAAISNSHAYDVIIKDVIPAGITYVPNSLFHLSGQAPGGSECGNAFNEIDPIAGLEICYDVLLDNDTSSVIIFQALVGLSFEGEIDNIASVEWTSLPGDLSAPQTPNNDFSTERWYDPGDNVNIYGGIDDNAIITTLGEEEVTLPASGFTPGVTTELGDRPNSSLYVQSGMTLVIPKIGVSTKIVGVPFGDTGWNVDWLGSQTGYLHGTSFPTYAGNTVLTSHIVDANGLPGPFAELKQLSWGDKINIYANGSKYVYQVVNTMIVSADNLSILNHKANDWVTLFTCSNFNPLTDDYDNRFAVQAVLISIE